MIGRDDPLHPVLTHAVAQLDDFLERRPNEVEDELFKAVRTVVRGRNEQIRRRRDEGSTGSDHLLKEINSVLSVLAGGEYPVVGVHLERIKEGRDALARLISPERH